MRINALRRELATLLDGRKTNRQPALRRSIREEWLYATDIAALLSGSEEAQLQSELSAAGWEFLRENDWILLKKSAAEPPEDWYEGQFGTESSCCLSLLERHAEDCGDDPAPVQRALIKAGEQGTAAYERICRSIHRDWAQRLRQKRQLPDISRKYFGA